MSEEKKKDQHIFVDLKGAVKNPGVYLLEKETRINELIDKAGGLLEDADTSDVNLSQKVKDQMVIYVRKKGEKSARITTSSTNNEHKVVNINLASEEELMKISGVGKKKAEDIIKYRQEKGEFKTKEDIMKIKGIGKGTFEKIKDSIEV